LRAPLEGRCSSQKGKIMPKQQEAKIPKGNTESSSGASYSNQSAVGASDTGVFSQARETVSNVADRAGSKITSRLDAQKDRAAEGLNGLAQALRQAGQQIREQNQGSVVYEYLDSATNQVERAVNYARSTDVKQMVGQVEQFARRQPALFFGGAFVLGLLGARFLKASGQTNPAYEGPTPRTESLVPSGNYTGTPGATPGSGLQTGHTGGAQTSAATPARPATRRGGV
jgi:hypothetical protein